MGFDISRMPPKMQAQALSKMMQQKTSKPIQTSESKFHNKPDTRGAHTFPSQKEAQRYDELMLLLKAGRIRKLRLQVTYTLTEGYTTTEWKRVKPYQYRADFVYEIYRDGKWLEIVEDAKGKRTQSFIDKKKQMFQKYGIDVVEV